MGVVHRGASHMMELLFLNFSFLFLFLFLFYLFILSSISLGRFPLPLHRVVTQLDGVLPPRVGSVLHFDTDRDRAMFGKVAR